MTWEEVTAVSTLALAAVTAWLARSTRRLAGEANAETRANWQPVLVVDAPSDDDDGTSGGLAFDNGRLSLDIINVGRGPALLVRAALKYDAPEGGGQGELGQGLLPGRTTRDVVAPGEHLPVRWLDFEPPPLPDKSLGLNVWSAMSGMITCGDVAYTRYETEIRLGFRVDGRVALLSQQFLGAARDRVSRVDRLRYRAMMSALAVERRAPGRFRGPVRRLIGRLGGWNK